MTTTTRCYISPDSVVQSVQLLLRRIQERCPQPQLLQTAEQLFVIATQAKERAAWLARPMWGLRVGTGLLVFTMLFLGGFAFFSVDWPYKDLSVFEFSDFLNAVVSNVVLVGAALVFVLTLETRIRRRRTERALHELRAMAHTIDMLQLTKDPDRMGDAHVFSAPRTQTRSAPFQLSRYLDCCAEMLALTGKIAAIYSQDFEDRTAIQSANEIEILATGLSRKIFQKIMIAHAYQVDKQQCDEAELSGEASSVHSRWLSAVSTV